MIDVYAIKAKRRDLVIHYYFIDFSLNEYKTYNQQPSFSKELIDHLSTEKD